MIPAQFDYVRPSTVDEAVAALAAAGEDAKVLGGGQSLMPVLRLRLGAPSVVVDTTRIFASFMSSPARIFSVLTSASRVKALLKLPVVSPALNPGIASLISR